MFLCDPIGTRKNIDIERSDLMLALVKDCPNVTVAYKPNRAIIFASSLFHRTEPFLFKPGFQHARGFLTFLYGKPRSVQGHVALSPEQHRASFAEQIAREVVHTTTEDNEDDDDDGSAREDDGPGAPSADL